MSVLLPAPLSPSRQCTSPRTRRSVTSDSAMTGPKYLLTFSSCRISSDMRASCVSAPAQRDAPADEVVEQHGNQQHAAEEDAVPVVVDARVADADLHDAEDQRAERRADDRAVAAREQAAADDRGDDGLELLLQAAVGGGGAGVGDLQDREQRRAKGGQHEQRDLHAADRDADVLR